MRAGRATAGLKRSTAAGSAPPESVAFRADGAGDLYRLEPIASAAGRGSPVSGGTPIALHVRAPALPRASP